MAAGDVALRAQSLGPDIAPPALEAPGAGFDAAHGVGARDDCDLRVTDGGVLIGGAGIVG